MKNIDNVIKNLYLCTTNSREKMQQTLIENVLFTLDMPMTIQEIDDFIKSEFHLEIDRFEIQETLNQLITENAIIKNANDKYHISSESKECIAKNVVHNKDTENKRNDRIKKQIESYNVEFTSSEITQIITTFNEYIYECFLEFGRKAIQYFLPYNNDDDYNSLLWKNKLNKLPNSKQKKIFEYLVLNYPETLTTEELNYLDNIAIKAEYFFSLGIPAQEFDKFQDLKLNGLVILVDTNFMYSILGLHSHRQNENCRQIITLISNNKIDCRLVFLKKTLLELQNSKTDFERYITRETLSQNQIKSLLDSEQLNSIAKDFFEKKLADRETPHPADKIKYGNQILKSNNIEIYNYQFPLLDDSAFINAKFKEYYDYHNIRNDVRMQKGMSEIMMKDDKKLEHDIYLREAIISLRKTKNKINEIDFICLTLDKGLIEFDRYANGKKGISQETPAPNFILPSIFLRKIRPFIPIITDNYKKAFITSITVNTIDTALTIQSEAVQRSMTFFKKLGIDDPNLILSIIKQELFHKEFIASEKENKEEEFIRGELDKAFESLRNDKNAVEKKLANAEKEKIDAIAKEQDKHKHLEEKIENVFSDFTKKEIDYKSEIEKIEQEKNKEIERVKTEKDITHKKEILEEKRKDFDSKTKLLIPFKEQAEKKYNYLVLIYILIIVSYFLILAILTYEIGWEKMEPITYFLSVFGLIAAYAYPAIFGNDWNISMFFKRKKENYISEVYSKFNFNIEEYKKLSETIENLELEVTRLETNEDSL
ncbi:MAG: hypothetical protein LBN27_11965 [Prevotellaceae bacterium]|jgi:hypothetical protein|nr:hypothetical protein [Prevotellaceae bacterium]